MLSVLRKLYLQNRAPGRLLQLIKGAANKKLLNAALFQLGWFACVLGGDAIAFVVTATILCIHQLFVVNKRFEWSLIAIVAVTGFVVDSSLAHFGVFSFKSPSLFYIPFWLFCLWVLFATTLNHSLEWLKNWLWLAVILGGFFGPMSYFAGSRLADVALSSPPLLSMVYISLCWAVLLPAFYLYIRFREVQ
ncbi:MAG: DUF2878 domain-containing protein [Oceanicoccus sp.]|uniref:DUF2878 domain-containing protein n=1 Tax=Oceanicoccus sp. TaxID=2691044 RepID=UPI00263615BE|nr:DUF2878 domain-containing protein [Oceanicoccus sp.]MCP3907708.1 DUF2878 domain-containing protein [Oceanicoccus sp.]